MIKLAFICILFPLFCGNTAYGYPNKEIGWGEHVEFNNIVRLKSTCHGVVIATKPIFGVLITAHCFFHDNGSRIKPRPNLVFNGRDVNTNEQKTWETDNYDTIIFPKFNYKLKSHDVAILILRDSWKPFVKNPVPILPYLIFSKLHPKVYFYSGLNESTVHQLPVDLVSPRYCKKLHGQKQYCGQLCSFDPNNTISKGHSGSPLITTDELNGGDFVGGLVSYEYIRTGRINITVLTNLAPYLDWANLCLGGNCELLNQEYENIISSFVETDKNESTFLNSAYSEEEYNFNEISLVILLIILASSSCMLLVVRIKRCMMNRYNCSYNASILSENAEVKLTNNLQV